MQHAAPSQPCLMTSSSSPQRRAATADPAVATAMLELELAQRDAALQRYRSLRERYELARLVKLRRQTLLTSHQHTLQQLHETLASLAALLENAARSRGGCGSSAVVSEAMVSAVEIALATSSPETLEAKLTDILAHPACLHAAPASAPFHHISACALQPLLLYATEQLPYRQQLHRSGRMTLASELARATLQLHLLNAAAVENGQVDDAVPERREATLRTQLSDARAAFKQAKDLQGCIKQRLYECHGSLTTLSPDASRADAEVAAEIRTRIAEELCGGRTALLRILCTDREAMCSIAGAAAVEP